VAGGIAKASPTNTLIDQSSKCNAIADMDGLP
jgi:hypothetical protein